MPSDMIVIVVAALLGTALGVLVRNGLIAIALALVLAGGVQYGLILLAHELASHIDQAALAEALSAQVGADAMAVLPGLAASGASAVLVVVLLRMSRREPSNSFWQPGERTGGAGQHRGLRAKTAVEQRAIHGAAASRLDKILRK